MNFQPPSNSLTKRDYQFIALVTVLFLIISAGLIYANLSLPKGGGDFLMHWVASRGFIFERVDPYSGQIPTQVQELVYDDPAGAGEEPYILDTPFHLLLLYFPTALLSDPDIVRAIYTLILELALFALAWLSLRLTEWETPRWFVPFFLAFCVFNFYSFQGILDANPVLLLALLYAGILLGLRFDQDEFVGALMAFSMYYWEVGLPFLLLVAWRSYKEGRVRVLAGFFMISFTLLAVSFLVYPNWFIPYLRAGMNNLRADFGFTVFESMGNLYPSYGGILAWAVVVILILALGYEWSAFNVEDERRFYWLSGLLLAVPPLLGFRTELEHLAVLSIPLALVFAIVHDRWSRHGGILTFLLLLVVFGVPWALYLFVLPLGVFPVQDVLFLFPPLFTVLGLYWIRWWALRPPRVWADLATKRSS